MTVHVFVLFVVFMVALCLLAYTYVGYPLALLGLRAVRTPSPPDRYESFPPVSMVVPVHNEADVIERKVENTLDLEYPGEFRCLFVSDSTDETDAILRREMTGEMDLLVLDERRGKSHAINRALSVVDTEIVVFSDANTMYESESLRPLVGPLADPDVGCVTGRLRLQEPDGGSGEGLYWRYELWLRRLEASLGTTVSANGGILAFRRMDLDPLPVRALVDDLVLTLRAAATGRRVVYEPEAVATERTPGDVFAEFARRVRIGAGNYQALVWFARLLAPTRGLVALQFASHKVLRWVAPWLLALALAANAILAGVVDGVVLDAVLGVQLGAYGLGLVGLASARARQLAVVRVPAYFLAMNAALALGSLRLLAGATAGIWTDTARPE